jgi:hypothetical protein
VVSEDGADVDDADEDDNGIILTICAYSSLHWEQIQLHDTTWLVHQ